MSVRVNWWGENEKITVFFCAGRELRWSCTHYHAACFPGHTDQYIMDLLKIEICHLGFD
jgi:hypothetical protein